MEQTNQIRINSPATNRSFDSTRANNWASQKIREKNMGKPVEYIRREENQQTLGEKHAIRTYRRLYLHACDQFKRADRDLGEIAAFVAASLTTATAIEAVMTVANDKLELSKNVLQEGFYVYIGIFLLILLYGVIRGRKAIQNRSNAEKEIDKAKEGLFRYLPAEQWPENEG